MEQQQNERPEGRTGKFTAWIGGITALVVALGGLATAVKEFTKDEPAAQSTAATVIPAKRPVSYKLSDGGTFRKIDGLWAWENTAGTWRYTELEDDGTTTVAVLRNGGEEGQDVFVRWPNAGGQAFQSYDNQENWRDGVTFTVAKS